MRILHISSVYPPHIVGGAEIVVEMLAEAQARRGHEVGAAYLSREVEPRGERNGVTVMPQRYRNLVWMGDVFRQPRALRTANKVGQMINVRGSQDFARAIADFAPDIVHTHSMVELPPMIWEQAARSGARIVHTLHDYDLLCSRASMFRNGKPCETLHPSCKIAFRWKSHFAGRIHAVAAVSAPVLAEHRRFGLFGDVPGGRQRVIWNAVARDGVPKARVKRRGALRFGFLGRLVPEKGIDVLIDACRLLQPDGWRLYVAGRAQEGDGAFRARANGLPIDFLGFCEPQAFLDSIDVLVVPSVWREPFGLTVAEAYARGVPVIGSRMGAIADMVSMVGEEWLVPPGNSPALAQTMTEAIRAGREALPSPDAFKAVLDAVALDRMVDGYEALYADLASGLHAA